MRLAQKYMDDRDLNTFVGSDHGFAPQFLAIDASKVLVDLGLLSKPQTSNCRTRHGRDDRQGQGLLRRRRAAGVPEPRRSRPRAADPGARPAGRLPAGRRRRRGEHRPEDPRRVHRAQGHQRLEPRRQAGELEGHRPHLHQGRGPLHPQRGEQHRRHGAPDPHGRPRGLRLPAVPVRRRHARHADRAQRVLRPARLRARRAEPALEHQHARDVPGRRPGDRAR